MEKYTVDRKKQKFLTVKELLEMMNHIRHDKKLLFSHGSFHFDELKRLILNPQYKIATIPKRNGRIRTLHIPETSLAFAQYCVGVLLNGIYRPNSNAYGFIEGKSIVENAKVHINKEYIFNVDLKDFFHSISYERLIEKLIRQPYYFSFRVANFIARLTTCNVPGKGLVLPQGSPSSPILTNIVCDRLDVRLSKLAEKQSITYSRYADDLTFSFDYPVLKKWGAHGRFKGLKNIILEIIRDEGFEINNKKTRFSFKNQHHEVTGLTTNTKINVSRAYIKKLRTELHNWEKDGYIKASYEFYRHHNNVGNRDVALSMGMENIISGKLSFIKMIKGNDDSTYQKMQKRFNKLCEKDKTFFHLIKNISGEVQENIFTLKRKQRYNNKVSLGKVDISSHWQVLDKRHFTESEKELVVSNLIVPTQYGSSVKFMLRTGKIKLIPLSQLANHAIGSSINMDTSQIIKLFKWGHKVIYRVI